MLWKILTEQPNTPEVSEEKINEFEKEFENLIKVLGKEVSKLKEVEFPNFNPSVVPEVKDSQGWKEFLLYWYNLSFFPAFGMEVLRVSRLRYLNRTLKKIGLSYHENRVLEFACNCRHFIEVSASYVGAAEELVNLSEPLRKTNIDLKSMSIEERKEYNKNLCDHNGEYLGDLIIPLVEKMGVHCLPTTVNLQDPSSFGHNNPLKPKEGQLGYHLVPKSITSKLQKFEKKIPNLHPTYDLLSEFLHPNSYILLSMLGDTPSDQFAFRTTTDEDDGRETLIEFFVRTDMHITLKIILKEVLKSDLLLKEAAIQWKNKVKGIVNGVLGLIDYRDFLKSVPKYSNYKCLCGSGKLLRQCCAKTSKSDLKKLKKYGTKLNISKSMRLN